MQLYLRVLVYLSQITGGDTDTSNFAHDLIEQELLESPFVGHSSVS